MEVVLGMTSLSAETLSEHDLIDAARDGDDRAFEELYARYSGRIAGFIHARVRDHGRSEDVAQEVFISALRRLRASSQAIQFKAWIYEIAKNACIDEHRRTRRTREVSLDSGTDESGPSVLPSRAPTPPAAAETKQRLTDLRGAFGGLSDSHHQLLVLREFEGLSYDEIGARTGMSRQMVESALFRARRKLTEEYEELASGRRCRQIQSTIEDGRALSARSLGVRERRVFARHLAHCQACRVSAHLAGVDETLVSRRRIGAKVAALLPLPLPLWRWPWTSGRARQAVVNAGTDSTVQTLSHAAEPAAATVLGGAAVAAAVLALAGTGAITAPRAIRAGRPLAHSAVTRPVIRTPLSSPASAAPTVGHVAPAVSTSAPAYGRLRLGEQSRRLSGTAEPRPPRHLRRVRRAPARPGTPAGLRTPARPPGAPTPAGVTTPAPLTLRHTAGSTLSQSLGAAPSPVTHLAAGLPLAPVSSGLGQTLGTGAPTVPGALSGVAAAGTGASQAAVGLAQTGIAASTQAAGATAGAVGQTVGAVSQTVGPVSQTADSAAGAVSGAAGQAAPAPGQAAAAATGATNTVASLLHGASGP